MDAATPAGLGCLGALRAAVLPAPLAQSETWDAPLLSIGRGVAASFDAYLNRKLARQVGSVYTDTADKASYCLDRYPLEGETIDKVELHVWGDAPGAYTDWTASALPILAPAAGVVSLAFEIGTDRDRVRFTFTGGFWLDMTPDLSGKDADGNPCPPGATPLPDDLRNAWTLQVAAEAVARNIADTGIIRPDTAQASTSLRTYGFTPAVLAILENGYRRYSF